MPLQFAVGQLSDRGKAREVNEDNLCVLLPPAIAPDLDALFVVADGMGGHNAGEVASGFVIETLKQLFGSNKYHEWVDYQTHREDYYVLVLKEVIERINAQLYQRASTRAEWGGMGTTVTAALVVGKKLYIGHVGDTRAYLIANGSSQQLTHDHSWVMEQVEQGAMTLEQAEADPRKNRLTRALGITTPIRVDRFTENLNVGDTLILCSDGLFNLVKSEEIMAQAGAATNLQQACQALVDLANQRGGHDNITVIIARVRSETEATPSAPPVKADAGGADAAGLVTQRLPSIASAPASTAPPSPRGTPPTKAARPTPAAAPPVPTTARAGPAAPPSDQRAASTTESPLLTTPGEASVKPTPATSQAAEPGRTQRIRIPSKWRDRLVVVLFFVVSWLAVTFITILFGPPLAALLGLDETMDVLPLAVGSGVIFTAGLVLGALFSELRHARH